MKVRTVRGCIILEDTIMTSAGEEVPAYFVYDKHPDRDHPHNATCNAKYYMPEDQEMSTWDVFSAVVLTYQTRKAFDKLVEFGIINTTEVVLPSEIASKVYTPSSYTAKPDEVMLGTLAHSLGSKIADAYGVDVQITLLNKTLNA